AEVNLLLKELSSRYTIPRKKAVERLAKIGTPAVVGLIHKLKDSNLVVQEAAAEALDRIGSRVAKAAVRGWRRQRGETVPDETQIIGEDATV
ncbi:MAG: HEAT repeat domain-containing protein, partial [Anaerolineae bacterium]|nr:HEAT repeat domain-containing protein [Anaerolineae bacterium]